MNVCSTIMVNPPVEYLRIILHHVSIHVVQTARGSDGVTKLSNRLYIGDSCV